MIKWAVMCAVPAAVAGGAYWHGPIVWGTVYAKPSAEVASALETMALPTFFGKTFGGEANGSRMSIPGQSMVYLFNARGAQAAKFVVDITPTDATHTRVSTRMEMSPGADKLFNNDFVSGSDEFEMVGTAAMNEKIDSLLSGRPYNEDVLKQAMMRFAMAHIGDIHKGVADTLNESIKAADAMEADRVASHGTPIIPGQPMSDPSRPAQ